MVTFVVKFGLLFKISEVSYVLGDDSLERLFISSMVLVKYQLD